MKKIRTVLLKTIAKIPRKEYSMKTITKFYLGILIFYLICLIVYIIQYGF